MKARNNGNMAKKSEMRMNIETSWIDRKTIEIIQREWETE
jgi:hypothetical protein